MKTMSLSLTLLSLSMGVSFAEEMAEAEEAEVAAEVAAPAEEEAEVAAEVAAPAAEEAAEAEEAEVAAPAEEVAAPAEEEAAPAEEEAAPAEEVKIAVTRKKKSRHHKARKTASDAAQRALHHQNSLQDNKCALNCGIVTNIEEPSSEVTELVGPDDTI